MRGPFPVLAAAAAVVAGLLLLASRAASGDLAWILAPTVALTEWFSGVSFSPSPRGGYLNAEHGIAIGRSCAGLRFLTIAFVLGIVSTVPRLGSPRARWLSFAGVFGGAYLLTVFANASRIAGALLLLFITDEADAQAKAGLHQAVGIAAFAFHLVSAYLLVRHAMKRVNPCNP